MPTADRLVHEAQEELDALNDRITELRAAKIRIGEQIKECIQERKPLARIVNAAQGRQSGNGDGPDQPE
jgi:septal ring factor EnvC (AmiA/AmiB activator)